MCLDYNYFGAEIVSERNVFACMRFEGEVWGSVSNFCCHAVPPISYANIITHDGTNVYKEVLDKCIQISSELELMCISKTASGCDQKL